MIVLIDLSSLAHPIFHMSAAEPDPNHTSQQVVARVHKLTLGQPHAAICTDSRRSFRKNVVPTYKANRPESDATLQHQIRLACEALARDGFPLWGVDGYEADDIIAAATIRAKLETDHDVLICSADKDLLQLVDSRVKVKSLTTDTVLDQEAVLAKFGVAPAQIVDYLSLVGDASDNIKGAKDIGPKTAAKLLQEHGTLDAVYVALREHGTRFTAALATNLREFESRRAEVRNLITLRADIDIPFPEVLTPRVAAATRDFSSEVEPMADETDDIEYAMSDAPPPERTHREPPAAVEGPPETPEPESRKTIDLPIPKTAEEREAVRQTGLALATPRDVVVVEAPPKEWELQLDPRSMKDARLLASDLHASRMFSAYGTPQAVLSSVILGRELGLPAMSAMRGIHIIEGKHSLSASLMIALVLKSGLAEYFEPVEFDEKHAVYETKRKGARAPVKMVHTIEMAQQAGLVKSGSGWMKNPVDMLCARASSRLARMVYPDILAGLYTPEEMRDARDAEQAAPQLEQVG
jgi:5'-3' exonuclease